MTPFVNNSYRQEIAKNYLDTIRNNKGNLYIIYSRDTSRTVVTVDQDIIENATIKSIHSGTTTAVYAKKLNSGLKIATEVKGNANPDWVGVSEITLPGDLKLWVSNELPKGYENDNEMGRFWKTFIYTEESNISTEDVTYNVISLILTDKDLGDEITTFTAAAFDGAVLLMQSRPKDTILPQGTTLLNTVLTF